MAQNITLMGASYSAVPAVKLPKTGGGTASFTDVTDTTAVASDVATGKVFHLADGTLATGTHEDAGVVVTRTPDSHGGEIVEITAGTAGGGSPIPVVMRPDAELVQRWTKDELVVEDLGLTIPAYATSAKTIKTGANLSPAVAMDLDYVYYIAVFALSTPIYDTETKAKGRCDYTAAAYLYEVAHFPASTFHTLDGTKAHTSRQLVVQANGSIGREMYWTSATAVGINNANTYGANATGVAPTISGTSLTAKYPTYGIRGSTTYMTSGQWSHITDIREQWVVEVWRAPAEGCAGWGLSTAMLDIAQDVADGGDLRR